MPRVDKRLTQPIQFSLREARIIEDLLIARRATMTVGGLEETRDALAINSALNKIVCARDAAS